MPVITTIPATLNRYTAAPIAERRQRRVAAYARVSTDNEEQLSSYEAQIDYYTNYINSRPDWDLIGVYTDEGISGTNTRHREGFKRMIADALDGKIDLIVTKSVSRFARNTVDSLSTIRKLKEKGIEVYFEKENIWTLDSKGELLITIMSSLAQEESRSISENVKWGLRKRAADGKYILGYSSFLGYKKGPNGKLVIDEEQAKVVRLIYRLFLEGYTVHSICKELMARKIPSPMGKPKWYGNTVQSILTNEKYKGDVLIQKTYIEDFITKKAKQNNGEIPQYYVENDHEAIIDRNTWALVQEELARRKKPAGIGVRQAMFSGIIQCGDCGGWYGRKVWMSNSKYRKAIYQCNDKFKHHCHTPNLTEEQIQKAFMTALNGLLETKEDELALLDEQLAAGKNPELDAKKAKLEETLQKLDKKIEKAGRDEYNKLVDRYDRAYQQLVKVTQKIETNQATAEKARQFKEVFITLDHPEFSEWLWRRLLYKMVVKKNITVIFREGTEVEVEI